MEQQKRVLIIAAVIIALALTGKGGYYIGRNDGQQEGQEEGRDIGYQEGWKTACADYEKEKDEDTRLNRSEFDGLGEIEGKIYVTGHKNPDSDTVCSAIAYAELLRKMGYDAAAVVPGDLNDETKNILERAGVKAPERLDNAAGCNMVLVDHSDYEQAADGMQDAHIIAVIDHHGAGSVRTANPLIYDAEPFGSTATIVWMRYRDYGLVPEKDTALIMIEAILSDTGKLTNDSTTTTDREAVKDLADLADISDLNDIL